MFSPIFLISLASCVGVRWSIFIWFIFVCRPPPSLPAPVKSDCWQGPCYKLATHLSLSLSPQFGNIQFSAASLSPGGEERDWEDKQVSSNLNVKPGADKYSVRVIICPLESVGANNWQHAMPGRSDWWTRASINHQYAGTRTSPHNQR